MSTYHAATGSAGGSSITLPTYSTKDLFFIYFDTVSGSAAPSGWSWVDSVSGHQLLARISDGTEGSSLTFTFSGAALATSWTPAGGKVMDSWIRIADDITSNPRTVSGTTSYGSGFHAALFGTGTGSFGGSPGSTSTTASYTSGNTIKLADVGEESATTTYNWTFSTATRLMAMAIFEITDPSAISVVGVGRW